MSSLAADYLAAAAAGDTTTAARLEAQLDAADAAREHRLNAPGALAAAALWYAANGIAVFPCAPGAKRPITRHGLHDATTDAETITDWWATTPEANIGLPTGRRFDVIDLDGPVGLLAFHDIADGGGFTEPVLAIAKTPRGRHYYVHPTGDGNRANLLPKVDYRGTGGYVVAPPSRTPDGAYRWLTDHTLDPATLHPEAR